MRPRPAADDPAEQHRNARGPGDHAETDKDHRRRRIGRGQHQRTRRKGIARVQPGQQAIGGGHHQPDAPAEIAPVHAQHPLRRDQGVRSDREPPRQPHRRALPEGKDDKGVQHQPRHDHVEGAGRRHHQQQAADQPRHERHAAQHAQAHPADRRQLVAKCPAAHRRTRQQREIGGGIGDVRRLADRQQRRHRRKRAAAGQRIHRTADEPGHRHEDKGDKIKHAPPFAGSARDVEPLAPSIAQAARRKLQPGRARIGEQ